MAKILDWQNNRALWLRLLETKTGHGVDWWQRRVKQEKLADEKSLRASAGGT